MKNVIGIIGTIAAGKNTIANYLARCLKIPTFQTSQPLKEIAKIRNIPLTREHIIELGTVIAREKGEEYLSRIILNNIEKSGIIAGMRQLQQIYFLRKHSYFTLIAVDANSALRFERARSRNSSYEAKTLHEFIQNELNENSGHHVQRLFECMKIADFTIINDSSFEDLYRNIDKLLPIIGDIG